VILAVYADDSADKERKTVFTVGGFMGFPLMFDEPQSRWGVYLRQKNLGYFKASEAESLNGQFDSRRLMMVPRAARAFEEGVRYDLGKIISDAHLGGIGMSLDIEAFRKVLREQPDAEQHFGTADCYIYTFRQFIINCISLVNADWPESASTQIAFVFDDHSNWREAEESYQALRNDPLIEPRLGTIAHASDKEVLALQMADLCAFEARYKTLSKLGLANERREFTCMDANNAWYSFSLLQEEHILQNLETARRANAKPSK
jgi:hypothetical protein